MISMDTHTQTHIDEEHAQILTTRNVIPFK